MPSLDVIFYCSFGALIAYTILLVVEGRRGERVILSRPRIWLDMQLEKLGNKVVTWKRWLGESAVRHTLHFLLHTLLRALIGIVSRFEKFLRALLRGNKRFAKSTIVPEAESEHLRAVKEHADSVKLPEEEKRKKRRALLK